MEPANIPFCGPAGFPAGILCFLFLHLGRGGGEKDRSDPDPAHSPCAAERHGGGCGDCMGECFREFDRSGGWHLADERREVMTPKRFFRGILALIFTFAVVYIAVSCSTGYWGF